MLQRRVAGGAAERRRDGRHVPPPAQPHRQVEQQDHRRRQDAGGQAGDDGGAADRVAAVLPAGLDLRAHALDAVGEAADLPADERQAADHAQGVAGLRTAPPTLITSVARPAWAPMSCQTNTPSDHPDDYPDGDADVGQRTARALEKS